MDENLTDYKIGDDATNDLIRRVGYAHSELTCIDRATTTLGKLVAAEDIVRHSWERAGWQARGDAVALLRRSPYQDQRDLAEIAERRLVEERAQRLALAFQSVGAQPLEAPSALVFWLGVAIFLVAVVGGLLWFGGAQ
jgi:hypothetical protein